MNSSTGLRAAVTGAVLGALAVAGMVGSAYSQPALEAQGLNRAAIVVDTGSGTTTRCVSFSEESISGTEALSRAGLSPVVRGFSGEGGAVCAINGVGCAADSNCLTCSAPSYWAYFRADNGAGGYTYSSVAATSTSVSDGDVEGWRWGTGSPPSYRSFASVCPLTTPTTSPPPPPPDPGGGGGPGPNGGPGPGGPSGPSGPSGPGSSGGGPDAGGPGDGPADGPGGTTTVPPSTTAPASGPDDGGSSSTGGGGDDVPEVDGEEAAARTPIDEDDGGGDARTWIAFTALLGGFGLAGWRIRRIRGRST
jgi:hypothetical protein